jgi:iron uptake system component EfeO
VRRPALVSCLAAAAALAAAGCGASDGPHKRPSDVIGISVSVGTCGTGWKSPTAGPQHFVLSNTDTRAGEVLLTDAGTGGVYADVEPLGPGTRTDLTVDLGAGKYAFRCAMEDAAVVTGPTVTIAGNAKGTTPVALPVTQGDLIAPTKAYEAYVARHLPTLTRLTRPIRTALARGDLAAARRAWLPAHLEYERLGAAYDAFGDLDAAINGLPGGLPRGVHDSQWQGLHRIEYGLWHGASTAALLPRVDAVLRAERALGTEFAKAQIDPLQIAIRAHEITENALQFELTGQTDFGSDSNLATVRANIDGTRAVLRILDPLLRTRYPDRGRMLDQLDRSQHDLDSLRRTDGTWPPVGALATAPRERLNADISELSELLAPVASILEPRRSS